MINKLTEIILKRVGDIPNKEKFAIRDGSPFGRAVSIAFYSKDNEELELLKNKVLTEYKKLGTLTNIEASDQKGMMELDLKLKEKAYLYFFLTYFIRTNMSFFHLAKWLKELNMK